MKKELNRRHFLKLAATGAVATGAAGLLAGADKLFSPKDLLGTGSNAVPYDAKKIFAKCGACSHTFLHLLNRQFGLVKEAEENASDPLAGGLMNTQHQCGMLWGSALAVGAESFRRFENRDQAIAAAIQTTRSVVESFSNRTKTVNCRDIACDFNNKFDTAVFMAKSLPGGFKNIVCMNIAEKWAPEVIQTATAGLSNKPMNVPQLPLSCAAEVARRMGAGEEQIVTVSGLAGGLGLSGNGCGALGAAIWLDSLKWCRENPGRSGYANPDAENIFNSFMEATDSELECSKICGRGFKTMEDHAAYINNGGCEKLINILAHT